MERFDIRLADVGILLRILVVGIEQLRENLLKHVGQGVEIFVRSSGGDGVPAYFDAQYQAKNHQNYERDKSLEADVIRFPRRIAT